MDLSQAKEALFAAPWEAFVETRARLADELARAGSRDDSRALKKVRRPTASAWATNQVVRRARPAVEAFLGASDRLRARQGAVLGGAGDRAAYQAAAEEHRRATAALAEAAGRALQEVGREADRAMIEDVLANVRAAALADGRRAELLAGRLEGDLPQGDIGLEGLLAGAGDGPAAATRPVPGPPAGRAPAAAHASKDEEQAAARSREGAAQARREDQARRLAEARDEEARAQAASAEAGDAVARAGANREAAEARLRQLEASVVEARQAVHEAIRSLRAAERTAAESQRAAARAAGRRAALEKESEPAPGERGPRGAHPSRGA